MTWSSPFPDFKLRPTSCPGSFKQMPWWPQMTTGIPVPNDTPYGPSPPPGSLFGRVRTFNPGWYPGFKAGSPEHILADKNEHPGMFGAVRKHDIHTGVDIYVPAGTLVCPVEDGVIVKVGYFTGPRSSPPTPWWEETGYVMVEGESGVVCYGELMHEGLFWHYVGDGVHTGAGDIVGNVATVLKEDKGRPRSMLHLELYEHGYRGEPVDWALGAPRPAGLLDPTPFLLEICK